MNTIYKYRPQSINDYIFWSEQAEFAVQQYIAGGNREPLILHGSPGSGKSRLADLIPKAIDGNSVIVDKINGSDLVSKSDQMDHLFRPESFDRLFEPPSQSRWYTVIEEMSVDVKAKEMLRFLMDRMDQRTQIIFTTNDLRKIDAGVRSRSTKIEIRPLTAEQFLPRALGILESEGISIPTANLLAMLQATYVNHLDNREYYRELDKLIFQVRRPRNALAA